MQLRRHRGPAAFAEKTGIPVALTLLGIGGFPPSHPLCLGMMGMHGEAFVNTAIQEADLLLAFGMRFDDRVTGNLNTYAPSAPRRSTSRSTPPRWARTCPWTWPSWPTCARVLGPCTPRVERQRHDAWLQRRSTPGGRTRAAATSCTSPTAGKLFAAHVMHDLWTATGGNAVIVHRRGPAPDVGGPVLQARRAAHAHHLRRPGHHGLRPARGHRGQAGAARRPRSGWWPATAASR